MKKIVIIGAGLSGLAAAFRLRELGLGDDLTMIEVAHRTGGTIRSVKRDGFLLEGGADSFLAEKPQAANLAARLGIENQLIPTNSENRRSFLVRENRLRAVPNGFRLIAPTDLPAFFASDIISAAGKVRLANEQFLPAAATKDDESLADFVRRRFGTEALERIAQPMLGGIYTADPEKLSMRATQPRFLELEQQHGGVIKGLIRQSTIRNPKSEIQTSGARYNLFLTFRDGMQTLIDALTDALPPNCLRLNTTARQINFDGKQWTIATDGETLTAEAVCLALPAHRIAKLLETQFGELARELQSIEHASTATVNFAFRREQIKHPLDGFGFVVPFVEKRTLMAATFSSVKFPNRAPANFALIRAFVGGALQPEMFDLSDDAMIRGALQDLKKLLAITGEPIFAHVEKWARSMPQYAVGHLAKIRLVENLLAQTPTLAIAAAATDGVGIPDSIRHGETAAEKLSASRRQIN